MSRRDVETVVKIGGALLAHPAHFAAVTAAIDAAARERRILIVPGGGPFADAVRYLDRTLQPSDHASHWMAVLAMDQHAHLIAERIAEGTIVDTPRTIAAALNAGQVPVLAPFRWLRDADPLPHSWDVTSDSIAAWVAGELGAQQLILIKAPSATGELVDAHFHRALPDNVTPLVVPADQLDVLRSALGAGVGGP